MLYLCRPCLRLFGCPIPACLFLPVAQVTIIYEVMPMKRGFLKFRDRITQSDKIERRVYTARDDSKMRLLNSQLADVDPQQSRVELEVVVAVSPLVPRLLSIVA